MDQSPANTHKSQPLLTKQSTLSFQRQATRLPYQRLNTRSKATLPEEESDCSSAEEADHEDENGLLTFLQQQDMSQMVTQTLRQTLFRKGPSASATEATPCKPEEEMVQERKRTLMARIQTLPKHTKVDVEKILTQTAHEQELDGGKKLWIIIVNMLQPILTAVLFGLAWHSYSWASMPQLLCGLALLCFQRPRKSIFSLELRVTMWVCFASIASIAVKVSFKKRASPDSAISKSFGYKFKEDTGEVIIGQTVMFESLFLAWAFVQLIVAILLSRIARPLRVRLRRKQSARMRKLMSDDESSNDEPALGHAYWMHKSSALFQITMVLGLIDGALVLSAPQMASIVAIYLHLMWALVSQRKVAGLMALVLLLQVNLSYLISPPLALQQAQDYLGTNAFYLQMFGLIPFSTSSTTLSFVRFTFHLWIDAFVVSFGMTVFKMQRKVPFWLNNTKKPVANSWGNWFLPLILLLICQILALTQVFLYHNVPSLMILVWILHSVIAENTALFARLTQRIYLFAAIIISVYYYGINLNGIRKPITSVKIAQFKHSFPEVILMELMLFFTISWSKIELAKASTFQVKTEDVAVKFAMHMSHKNRSTFTLCVFLMIPWFEMVFLATILLLGMNRVDVYHLVFMLFFISLAMLPQHRNRLTRLMIIYTSAYILGNYVLSLMGIPDSLVDFFRFIGLNGSDQYAGETAPGQLLIKYQRWIIVLVAYYQTYVQTVLPRASPQIAKYYKEAFKMLVVRQPFLTTIFQFLYNMKRNIVLLIVFTAYVVTLNMVEESIFMWGYLMVTFMEIFFLSSPWKSHVLQINSWRLMTSYSMLVILFNTIYLFLHQDFIWNLTFIQNLFESVPSWATNLAYAGGLGNATAQDIDGNQMHFFVPHLIFFISSVYVRGQLVQWVKDDQLLQKETDNFDDPCATCALQNRNLGSFVEVAALKKDIQASLDELQHAKADIDMKFGLVRHSPTYFAFATRKFWFATDFITSYSNLVVLLVCLLVATMWWWNFVTCLEVILQLIVIWRVCRHLQKAQSGHFKTFLTKDQGMVIDESEALEQLELEAVDRRKIFAGERYGLMWVLQFWLTAFTIIMLYPSNMIRTYYHLEGMETGDHTVAYYSFLAGIYQIKDKETLSLVREFQTSWGYWLIIFALLWEAFSVSWLRDRFGCDIHWYTVITSLIQKQKDIEEKIKEEKQLLDKAYLIVKRNLMRAKKQKEQFILNPSFPIINSGGEGLPTPRDSKASSASIETFERFQSVKGEVPELRARLEVFAKLMMLAGIKRFLEAAVISALLIAAVVQMNACSLFYLLLTVISIKAGVRRLLLISLSSVAFYLTFALLAGLSNMTPSTSPQQYPIEFQQDEPNFDRFKFPWYLHSSLSIQWFYYWSLISVKQVYIYVLNYLAIGLMYAHFVNNTLWVIRSKVRYQTTLVLDIGCLDDDQQEEHRKSVHQILTHIQSVVGDEDDEVSSDEAIEEAKRVNESSALIALAKACEHFVQVQAFPIILTFQLMLALVSSNPICLLPFLVLCFAINSIKIYLFPRQANSEHVFIHRKVLIPFLLLELGIQFIIQLPLPALDSIAKSTEEIGIQKYWKVSSTPPPNPTVKMDEFRATEAMELIFQVAILALSCLQVSILKSSTYFGVEKVRQIGRSQGRMTVWLFNNHRLSKYFSAIDKHKAGEDLVASVKNKYKQWKQRFGGDFRNSAFIEKVPSYLQDSQSSTEEEENIYLKKYGELSIMIRAYLFLLHHATNQALIYNEQEEVEAWAEHVRKGATKVDSPLETALRLDAEREAESGRPSSISFDSELSSRSSSARWLGLLALILQSNLEVLSYILMMIVCFFSPGVLTLIYPIYLFGFALIELPRPKSFFWKFISVYTQFLLLIQLILTLPTMRGLRDQANQFFTKYYLGIYVVYHTDLMGLTAMYWPQVLLLWSVAALKLRNKILGIDRLREPELEPIAHAKRRYEEGTGRQRRNDSEAIVKETFKLDIEREAFAKSMRRAIDDFHHVSSVPPLFPEICKEELKVGYEQIRPYNSELGPDEAAAFLAEKGILPHQAVRETPSKRRQDPLLKKVGVDLYNWTISFQVILCGYVLLFFSKMEANDQVNFLHQVNKNEFNTSMVTVLFVLVSFMILERFIYRSQYIDGSLGQLRMAFHWIVLIVSHLYLFFYLPIRGNLDYIGLPYCDFAERDKQQTTCNNIEQVGALMTFYILVCCYLAVSSLQIKKGLPGEQASHFMMQRYNLPSKYLFQVFYYVPFIFELRGIVDWTFSSTALDVYQWIKLAQVQSDLYLSKVNNAYYRAKPVGQRIPKYYQVFVGIFLTVVILLLMLGPMFIFSTGNFFGQLNPVNSATVSMSLRMEGENGVISKYKLFQTDSMLSKTDNLTESQYRQMGFQDDLLTKNYEPEQIQFIAMSNYPQESWFITKPSKDALLHTLTAYIADPKQTDYKLEATLHFKFTRGAPDDALNPETSQTINLFDQPSSLSIAKNLTSALKKQCDAEAEGEEENLISIELTPEQALFSPVVKLMGTSSVIEKVSDPLWNKRIQVVFDSCQKYWSLNQIVDQDSNEHQMLLDSGEISHSTDPASPMGFSMFVFSRKILPSYFSLPLITFYISIVYVIAQVFRSGLVPVTAHTIIYDAPYPDDLLMLCEAIFVLRIKKRFKEEEQLYYLLLEVLRSPEVLREICGTSLKDD